MSLVEYAADSSSDEGELGAIVSGNGSLPVGDSHTEGGSAADILAYPQQKHKHRTGPVKIMVPAPSSSGLEECDDSVVKKPKPGSGLLSRLPKARTQLKRQNQKPLIPDAILKKFQKRSPGTGVVAPGNKPTNNKPNPYLIHLEQVSPEVDSTAYNTDTHSHNSAQSYGTIIPSAPHYPSYSSAYPDEPPLGPIPTALGPPPRTSGVSSLNDFETDEGFLRLQGKKGRQKAEKVDFIDIRAEDVQKESEYMRLKAPPESRYKSRKGMDNLPSGQQRKKHQITYLAFQAKERELQLQNQWAENRATRKAAQSRYGF